MQPLPKIVDSPLTQSHGFPLNGIVVNMLDFGSEVTTKLGSIPGKGRKKFHTALGTQIETAQ